MPDFRIVSESYKELSELEEMFRKTAKNTNNIIEKKINEYGTFFYIINPLTGFDISFSVYNMNEFKESYDEKYGGVFQVNWSSKMPVEDIDNFMLPVIKEIKEYLPDLFVESGDDFITLDDFIKRNEED
ncbi:hypothetical protein FLACOL_01164 [Flavobacterium columnare]|uniref:Uncharacterized protein n=2 Tax=Flavobacterium TaxID=237 RepID=A0A2N9P9X2_9FLAO|nr:MULTISPECIES: hypothetical protein [Flavobacterium]MCH4829542.1 hypothetical protein [Flavobacterium columnare]MCH4831461.1 hypothetical protein [Flavobacterium columnare]OWP87262.1 hypothetical protein BWK60_04515 [Flavobacterium covae]QYS91902.1 hypothetical protein JJC04_04355 [Flavobacterium covae]SPE77172.1 hypothetical protein FLACOL_01164 [Flavobacterium columnare]